MEPNKQMIAIAEVCGWTKINNSPGFLIGVSPSGYAGAYVINGIQMAPVPDYLSDLNAMHKVEKMFTQEQFYKYSVWLGKNTVGTTTGQWAESLIHATAAQRAEAFLRTVGKWEDA